MLVAWLMTLYLRTMNEAQLSELLGLPVDERIRLVGLIWDSIAAVPEPIEVDSDLRAELKRRLEEFEASPDAGFSWDEAKEHLSNGTWRTA